MGGGIRKIDESLTSQLGHTRIGVAEQGHERANPAQFIGSNTDYGYRPVHKLYL